MAVSENVPDEIFNERAQYLGNIDELLFEIYDEEVLGKKTGTQSESAHIWNIGSNDIAQKISVADQILENKEYKTYIQSTHPEQMSKSKIPAIAKKSIDEELNKFRCITNV